MIRKGTLFQIAAFVAISFLGANAAAADPSTVLINGPRVSVTVADLTAELTRIPASDRVDFMLDVKRVNTTLEQIYLRKELARQAEDLKLDEQPDVRAKLANERNKVLAQERVEAYERALKLPDFAQRAKELYLADKEKYRIEPTAKASHILITWNKVDREAALKKAQEIRASIVSGAKTFDAAAVEFSEDPSAKNNAGDLGWFDAKKVVKPFADATFALNAGDISQPVETRFGYHIILLHEKKPGGYKTFDEVKAGMIEQLKSDYVSTARTLFLNEIKGDKRLIANEAEIVKLNPRANMAAGKPDAPKTKQP